MHRWPGKNLAIWRYVSNPSIPSPIDISMTTRSNGGIDLSRPLAACFIISIAALPPSAVTTRYPIFASIRAAIARCSGISSTTRSFSVPLSSSVISTVPCDGATAGAAAGGVTGTFDASATGFGASGDGATAMFRVSAIGFATFGRLFGGVRVEAAGTAAISGFGISGVGFAAGDSAICFASSIVIFCVSPNRRGFGMTCSVGGAFTCLRGADTKFGTFVVGFMRRFAAVAREASAMALASSNEILCVSPRWFGPGSAAFPGFGGLATSLGTFTTGFSPTSFGGAITGGRSLHSLTITAGFVSGFRS